MNIFTLKKIPQEIQKEETLIHSPYMIYGLKLFMYSELKFDGVINKLDLSIDIVSFDVFFHSYKEVEEKMNLLQIIILIFASLILVSSAKKEGNKFIFLEL